MKERNRIRGIIIAIAIGVALYFTQQIPQKPPNKITSKKEAPLSPKKNSSLDEINNLKEKIKFQKEVNAQISNTNNSLEKESKALEKAKIQLEESKLQVSAKIKSLEEKKGRVGKNKEKKNFSPYALGKNKDENAYKKNKTPRKHRNSVTYMPFHALNLTQEQKEFKKLLDEKHQKKIKQYLQDQTKIITESMEKSQESRELLISILTEEQIAELDRMVQKEIEKIEKRKEDESSD